MYVLIMLLTSRYHHMTCMSQDIKVSSCTMPCGRLFPSELRICSQLSDCRLAAYSLIILLMKRSSFSIFRRNSSIDAVRNVSDNVFCSSRRCLSFNISLYAVLRDSSFKLSMMFLMSEFAPRRIPFDFKMKLYKSPLISSVSLNQNTRFLR